MTETTQAALWGEGYSVRNQPLLVNFHADAERPLGHGRAKAVPNAAALECGRPLSWDDSRRMGHSCPLHKLG
jgi:hypothetical protein